MKVFENVDIEFFDLKDKKPSDGDTVTIVIKDSSFARRSYYNNNLPLTGEKALTTAIYKEYKTRPCKFTDSTGYFVVNYIADEIVCWAKIKQ